MKKLSVFLFTLTTIILCCFCAASANEDEPVVFDHVVYGLCTSDDSPPFYYVASLFDTEKAKQTLKTVTIRAEVNGLPVKWIETVRGEADRDETSLAKDGLVPLFPDRFIDPEGAVCETIVLPHTLERIGESAFYGMTHLKTINLPQGLKLIGSYAFERCQALKKIRIPGTVDSIHSGAFCDCCALRSVILEEGVRHIERSAFCGCTSLQKISLPNSLRSIRSRAFANCSALETIRIPDQITVLKNDTFRGCGKLKSVRLSRRLTVLELGVFADCGELESIAFPDTLRTVCRDAFLNTAIVRLTVPAACGTFWFNGMTKLKQVTLEDRTGKLTIPGSCFSGLRALEQVTLPKSAKITIASRAFARCVRLTKVKNSGAIVRINPKAFYGCKALPALTLSGRLRRIDGTALLHCENLVKLCFTGTSSAFLSADASFLQTLPESCRIYVKTEPMKQAFLDKGCTNKITVKADLK